MVCIPCIIAPVLLFIWYRFIQPIMLKFWNPWAPKIEDSSKTGPKDASTEPKCPLSSFNSSKVEASAPEEPVLETDKKND